MLFSENNVIIVNFCRKKLIDLFFVPNLVEFRMQVGDSGWSYCQWVAVVS